MRNSFASHSGNAADACGERRRHGSGAEECAVAGGKAVSGTVTLSAALASRVKPDDALFVFARPSDGSKMPISIVRAQVKDLPLKFTLDDSLAMSPAVKIANFEQVIIAARVSKSGRAMPQSGDLEAVTKPVKVGSSGLAVAIDKVVPQGIRDRRHSDEENRSRGLCQALALVASRVRC